MEHPPGGSGPASGATPRPAGAEQPEDYAPDAVPLPGEGAQPHGADGARPEPGRRRDTAAVAGDSVSPGGSPPSARTEESAVTAEEPARGRSEP